MSIGMNLAGITNDSTEFPFLDRFKSFGQWVIKGGSYGYSIAPTSLFDANGWPTNQPDGTFYVANVALDPMSLATPHRYELTYSGTATFYLIGVNVVSREPGKIVFDDIGGAVNINLDTNGTDPVHDIHVVRQDQVALYNSGELFNPAFIAATSNWSVLRFMDWNATNGSEMTSWSQRPQMSQASWGNVPLEVEVKLANETHSDMWLNIPVKADDNYVRQLATYVHDHLDPTLTLHLEYSNEVWNQSFSQSAYAQQQADMIWGNGSYVPWGHEIYYGYRSAQIASIAQSVFGTDAPTRLDGVLSTFTWWTGPDVDDAIATGVARANLGSISSLFKEYGVTTYFGDALGVYPGNEHDRPIVYGWATSGAAGLDAAFHQLEFGGLLDADFSLASLLPVYAIHEARAQSWGLDMVAYEGGLSAFWFASDHQAELTDFFNRLLADPRMAALYTRMAADFAAAGGSELTAFTDTGRTGIFGPWGTSASIYDTSPRLQALLAASGRITGTTTAAGNYTMADNEFQLSYSGSTDFTGTGNANANVITGGNGGNHLYGLAGDDTLIGGTGADYLDGGTGADRMTGGAGNDIYIVDNAGDVVIELPGEGIDEVRTSLNSHVLADNVENLTFMGTGDFTGTGNALDNVITGGAGNDILDGGLGADRLIGGAGNDIYIVDNIGDIVVELAGEGIDEVRTSLTAYTLGANVENLTYTGSGAFIGVGNALDNVITGGTGGNQLYGGAGNDTLIGGTGADYLDGGTGADRMVGGAGNDIYIVDNAGDVVVELPGGGIDEVRTSLNAYTLGANLENLTFVGTGNFTGTGNALDNVITGGAGDDWLDGGAGNDTLIGGAGNDTYVVASVGDVVVEQANGGIDTVRTSLATYTLGANVENLVYTGTGSAPFTGTGNDLDNVITGSSTAANRLFGGAGHDVLTGGAGADYLDGGTGADVMTGGAGNDIYIVDNTGDVVVELPNGGLDEVRSTALTYTLSANIENLTFVGVGNFTGTGNADSNLIVGGAGNDTLYGGAGNDTLLGGAGNDWLDGGTGADKMIGGLGDDTYVVDNVGDKLLENPGEGYDTVISSITFALPANVERLILAEGFTIDGSGNNLANVLTGNSSNNRLWGFGGNDVIDGGAGDDTIDGGDGNDTIIGGAGKDVLTGGNGADTFVFRPGDLASVLANSDRITDFSHSEGDRLDVSALRLSQGTPMSFVGTAAFGHHAGEIRAVASGGDFDVSIDLDGDGVADLHLLVTSRTGSLVSGDFIL